MYDALINSTVLLLDEPLQTTRTGVKTQLRDCLALTAPILRARVATQAELANKRNQARHPKDKDFTDFDRNIMLEGLVSEYTATYETLKGLETLLGERIQVLRSLL